MPAPATDELTEVDEAIAAVAERHDSALNQLSAVFDATAAAARSLLDDLTTEPPNA